MLVLTVISRDSSHHVLAVTRKVDEVKELFWGEAIQAMGQFSNRGGDPIRCLDSGTEALQRRTFKFGLGKVQSTNHHLERIVDGVRDLGRNRGVALNLLQFLELFQRADINRDADEPRGIARDERSSRGQPVDFSRPPECTMLNRVFRSGEKSFLNCVAHSLAIPGWDRRQYLLERDLNCNV